MKLRLSLIALAWVPAVSQFACTICKEGGTITNPDGMVTTLQGQTATCGALQSHVAQLHQEACEDFQTLAGGPCGCPGFDTQPDESQEAPPTESQLQSQPQSVPFVCPICESGEIQNPTGYALNSVGLPTSCQELQDTRETISESACSRVQNFAKIPCGCISEATTSSVTLLDASDEVFSCSLCGDGVIGNPNGIVVNDRGQQRTCAELEANRGSIPESICPSLKSAARGPCECNYNQLTQGEWAVDLSSALGKIPTRNPIAATEIEVLSQCSICGEGEMAIPDGMVTNRQGKTARCDVLDQNPKEISLTACANIQELSKVPCGCVSPFEVPDTDILNEIVPFQCSICGDGEITLPDGIVTTPEGQASRCNVLQANAQTIPEAACSDIQQMSGGPCGCTKLFTTTVEDEDEPQIVQEIDESLICRVCGGKAQELKVPGNMVTTAAGVFTCHSLFSAGLAGTIPMDDCGFVQMAVARDCGCQDSGPTPEPSDAPFQCSVCPDGMFVSQPNGIIATTEKNTTCAEYNHEANMGRVGQAQCAVLQQISGEPCGCAYPPTIHTQAPKPYECQICGEGRMVGLPDAELTLPNYSKLSCSTLQQRAEAGIIHEFQCPLYQPIAEQYCGCINKPFTAPPAVFDCPICGEGLQVTNMNGVVTIPTQPDRTCSELLHAASVGHITENQCFLLHPFVQTPCECVPIDPENPYGLPFGSMTAPSDGSEHLLTHHGDCFKDLSEIQELERGVRDTSRKRLYVLCPGTTFDMGTWTEGEIKDGQPFLALRPNVVYQCGHDGSRMNNCILKGGDFGLASYYEVFDGIYETVPGVEVRGLTFQSQKLFSVILKSAGDITFTGCAFKVRYQ